RQKAEIVVLACNGIGTPRVLLNSAPARFPDGLANRSGLVGRNLMFHPYGLVTGIFPEALEGYKGPTGCCIISQEFYETDVRRGFARGYSFEMIRGMGPVSTALFAMSTGRAPWGAAHHDAYAAVWDRTAGMVAICEDLPEECNRVTLDPELVDSDGIPAPKIDYRLGENSQRMLAHAVARRRGARGRGCEGDARRRAARAGGMASHGHGAHGPRPRDVGRERVGALPRRQEPVHRRRQHLRDCGRRESHQHDPGTRALHRR